MSDPDLPFEDADEMVEDDSIDPAVFEQYGIELNDAARAFGPDDADTLPAR